MTGVHAMVVRKQVNNPTDFFDEAFSMYQEGFSANGEFENKHSKGTTDPRVEFIL